MSIASGPLIDEKQAQAFWSRFVWPRVQQALAAGQRLRLTVREETRSLEQNDRMWAMLGEVSAQVNWHGSKLTSEEWKDVFSAALKRQKVVPGIDGGFVVIGARTSKMTISAMSELMELMAAFGAEHEVNFRGGESES